MRRFVLVEQDTLERNSYSLLGIPPYRLTRRRLECDPRGMESLRVSGAHLPPTARALAGTPGHRMGSKERAAHEMSGSVEAEFSLLGLTVPHAVATDKLHESRVSPRRPSGSTRKSFVPRTTPHTPSLAKAAIRNGRDPKN